MSVEKLNELKEKIETFLQGEINSEYAKRQLEKGVQARSVYFGGGSLFAQSSQWEGNTQSPALTSTTTSLPELAQQFVDFANEYAALISTLENEINIHKKRDIPIQPAEGPMMFGQPTKKVSAPGEVLDSQVKSLKEEILPLLMDVQAKIFDIYPDDIEGINSSLPKTIFGSSVKASNSFS